MKFHEDGTQAAAGEIFVFGSNESGIHGAGAAAAALDFYGAKWGHGFGFSGQSFAIPTKDWVINSLSLSQISFYVKRFILVSKIIDKQFFITRIGCGLAGYKDCHIAPMFKGIGDNCDMPIQWKEYL